MTIAAFRPYPYIPCTPRSEMPLGAIVASSLSPDIMTLNIRRALINSLQNHRKANSQILRKRNSSKSIRGVMVSKSRVLLLSLIAGSRNILEVHLALLC